MAIVKKRFSKDPKVFLVSIEEFLEKSNYLTKVSKSNMWKKNTRPEGGAYYKLTPQLLIKTYYELYRANYGTEWKRKLGTITVAYRDGKTEYELFDKKINDLYEERNKFRKCKKRDRIDCEIEELINAKKLLPKHKTAAPSKSKPYESHLIDTGYKTTDDKLMNKYLVFDVETNGLRTSNDDLLSLTIYDPTTGICYNRFFPLDLQPLVLTGYINGISEKAINSETHMTQDELDWIIENFQLNDRILLSYSGGKGTFDSLFVQNYCKRHGIVGFENLQFENIKNHIPEAPYGSEGQLTKDNLCRLFNIEGVKEKHTSYSDCLLEWKLFEKLESECIFFINEHLFRYTPDYIVPVSYLSKYPLLCDYAHINVPHVYGQATELFKISFPKRVLKYVKKFPTNITGITIEHGINSYLHAEKQNNVAFLTENKSHLEYIGSLDSKLHKIPVIAGEDGTYEAINLDDNEYVKQVNDVTKVIIDTIKPLADYLIANIFKGGKIMSQELSVSDDRKVLALCDLSDSENVVEIKTYKFLYGEIVERNIARQLYYQAKGRNTYAIAVCFDTHTNERTWTDVIDGLNVYLYKIELEVLSSDNTTVFK